MGGLNPEWRSWLALHEATIRAAKDPVWDAAAPAAPAPDRPSASPLLHGATISLDRRPARRWVRRLIRTAAQEAPGAASLARLRFRRLDVFSLLDAAIAHDEARVREIAAEAGAEPHALGAVAQLAVRPLLQACGRRLRPHVPEHWDHGFCPVCGAWPAFSEMRGIDRARQMRCGRCGGDWAFVVLRCPYCDEKDHRRQGALVPDGQEEIRKVDTCQSCKGYVKAVTTLGPIEAHAVALEDLATVELDVAALERGYSRPARPGWAVAVRWAGRDAAVPASGGEAS